MDLQPKAAAAAGRGGGLGGRRESGAVCLVWASWQGWVASAGSPHAAASQTGAKSNRRCQEAARSIPSHTQHSTGLVCGWKPGGCRKCPFLVVTPRRQGEGHQLTPTTRVSPPCSAGSTLRGACLMEAFAPLGRVRSRTAQQASDLLDATGAACGRARGAALLLRPLQLASEWERARSMRMTTLETGRCGWEAGRRVNTH